MSEDRFCVEEGVMQEDLSNNPSCPHGPTLLFCRKYQNETRKFYACSAMRDRKQCSFFLWADKQLSESSKHAWDLETTKFVGEETHIGIYDSVRKLKKKFLTKGVGFCRSCSIFILDFYAGNHEGHGVELNLDLNSLKWPTKLLKPFECSKTQAQYFFSKSSVKVMIDLLTDNDIKSVICIGAPRIHEYIQNLTSMRSILLDLDRRYHMFYSPSLFCWYNTFNNYFFFGNEAKKHFTDFIVKSKDERIMIILDPPFGGRLEPLSCTLRSIQSLIKQLNPHVKCDVPVFLIYPYFMEQHVATCLPTFSMVDYVVTYDNHPKFSTDPLDQKSRSPVRIFTNLDHSKIKLPAEDGYRFCSICNRWVSDGNKHCKHCGKCTSKNGSPYIHCFKCKKCVKPSWEHCQKCKRCCLKSHNCEPANLSVMRCQNCGKGGHKQEHCTKAKEFENGLTIALGGKRKQNFEKIRTKKRRKYNN